MMYRAKITHCASIIANIYGSSYPYIIKDARDIYIEVRTTQEVILIEDIEMYQRATFERVKNLELIAIKEPHD